MQERIVNVLKLGGSVISEKARPFSLNVRVLEEAAREIGMAIDRCNVKVVVVHGGGSFGHYVVKEHGGVSTNDAITQTVQFMRELNDCVTDIFMVYGVPALPMDTHALCYRDSHSALRCSTEPVRLALSRGLVPVLYGDVILGASSPEVLSGDELAWYLASVLIPSRLLFATDVDGVYIRDPNSGTVKLADSISARSAELVDLGGGREFDVTGGMRSKLLHGLKYASAGIREVLIFSGARRGNVYAALCGREVKCTRVSL